jgi:hypothetical protein
VIVRFAAILGIVKEHCEKGCGILHSGVQVYCAMPCKGQENIHTISHNVNLPLDLKIGRVSKNDQSDGAIVRLDDALSKPFIERYIEILCIL